MRRTESRSGVRVQATAGSHVVILGMSASKVARKGLLGFAIRRTDETEGERFWLRGMKTFHEVVPFQQPGLSYSLLEHPIQTFRWADYTAKPGHNYIYEILPMRGTPKFLTEGEVVEVAISTESEGDLGEAHDVYFNRGVAASQAYSRRFGNLTQQVYHSPARWASGCSMDWIDQYHEKRVVRSVKRGSYRAGCGWCSKLFGILAAARTRS